MLCCLAKKEASGRGVIREKGSGGVSDTVKTIGLERSCRLSGE